jgi:hypothetical protein
MTDKNIIAGIDSEAARQAEKRGKNGIKGV